jgi:hypothetical protein
MFGAKETDHLGADVVAKDRDEMSKIAIHARVMGQHPDSA